MNENLSDRAFELFNKIDDTIDDWYASKNRRLKRIHLRRLNRCLVGLGESAYPDFRRVKPATLETVSRWASVDTQGAAGIYREITLFMIDQQNEKAKVRPELTDGKATIRGMAVETNVGFFVAYIDKGNPDAILERAIERWAEEVAAVEALTETEFDALCKGRKQTADECLASFFADLPKWMSDAASVKEELQESVENLELWAEWEREDAERTAAAQEALAKWRAERGK